MGDRVTYRLGRHNPQTIYRQAGPEPSSQRDVCVAFGASRAEAAVLVLLLNRGVDRGES